MSDSPLTNNALSPEETSLLEAFRNRNYQAVGDILDQHRAEDEERYKNNTKKYALKIIACELVGMLDNMIDDYAARLAKSRDEEGQWANETAANDLLHALAEFLIQADIEEGYETDTMVHRHHLSDLFAQDWFDLSPLSDGTLVAVDNKGGVK